MEMRFPCYVHGMLKMDSFSGVVRPDRTTAARSPSRVPAERRVNEIAPGGALLADAGRGHGRCPAVPGRLPLRLHRADAQPLPAHGHHAADPAAHEAGPQGHPARSGPTSTPRRSATTRSGPRAGSASTATPSSTRTRSSNMVDGRHAGAGRHAAVRRRLGLVLRLRRALLAAHHGRRRPRPADRQGRTTSALPPGMLERGVDWLKNYQAEQIRLHQERADQDHALQGARRQPRRPGLHGAGRRRRQPTTRCATSSIATARSWRSTPRRCSAWPCTSSSEAEKLAMILQEHRAVSWCRTTRTRRPT